MSETLVQRIQKTSSRDAECISQHVSWRLEGEHSSFLLFGLLWLWVRCTFAQCRV